MLDWIQIDWPSLALGALLGALGRLEKPPHLGCFVIHCRGDLREASDAEASGTTGSAPGARQLEALRDGRYCTNSGEMPLDCIQIRHAPLLDLVTKPLRQNGSELAERAEHTTI